MIAILAVNVPGFPIPRPRIHVQEGKQTALVAAVSPVIAAKEPNDWVAALRWIREHSDEAIASWRLDLIEKRLRKVEAVTGALTPDAIEAIAASIARGDA